MSLVLERIEKCRLTRKKSKREATRKLSDIPSLFGEIRQGNFNYLALPAVSSERRKYVPIGFLNKDTIVGNKLFFVENATLYHFGVLTSEIHMAWMRAVCGRLENRYNYSNTIVYNNFPWPAPNDKQRQSVETAAQGVLDARAKFPKESLATLYDPTLMPPELAKAHKALDNAVKNAYGGKGFASEAERVADLMERYQKLTTEQK